MNHDKRRSRKRSEKEAEKTTGKPRPKTRKRTRAKDNTTTTPKRSPAAYRETRPKSRQSCRTDAGNAHRTTEGPQANKNPPNEPKAHRGRNTKPGRPETIPGHRRTRQSCRSDAKTEPANNPQQERPKEARATEQTHRRPATSRNDQRPKKYTRKPQNATTGQI